MDRIPPANPEIQRLIDLSAAARSQLTLEVRSLKQRFDVPARLRGSLQQHPTGWLLGSLASGLAASLMFRRNPPPSSRPKTRRLPARLVGMAWTAARPLAKIWLGDQVKNWLMGQALQSPSNHLLTRFVPTSKSR